MMSKQKTKVGEILTIKSGTFCSTIKVKKDHVDEEGRLIIDEADLLEISINCNK